MTNLVIKSFPANYCFKEDNGNNKQLKISYIPKSDINEHGFQSFVLDNDFKEINKITEEDSEEYIEKFEKSKFKSHYDKIKDIRNIRDKKRRKKIKEKVKQVRGKYE